LQTSHHTGTLLILQRVDKFSSNELRREKGERERERTGLGLLENRISLKNRKSFLEPKTLGQIARSSTPKFATAGLRRRRFTKQKRKKEKQRIRRRQMGMKKPTCEKKLA
jgi:hypothetical protein